MSYLVFCSFEVGGLPYKMAEALNRHGVETCYFSSAGAATGHDSSRFHFGAASGTPWDLTPREWTARTRGPELEAALRRVTSERRFAGCFASGAEAHLLARVGLPYVYWSYGSDLDEDCFMREHLRDYPLGKRVRRQLRFYRRVRGPTRASIRRADAVMIAPYQLEALSRVAGRCSLFFLPHVLPTEPEAQLEAEKRSSRERICQQIEADRFLLSTTRHVWTQRHRRLADHKGNDVSIRAFAKYLERRKGDVGTKLVLVRKGPDVAASEALVGELGIASRVVFVDEMPREELNAYYAGATLCLGQFTTPAITYAALEPLAWGTPCVSWFQRGDPRVPLYAALPPISNTREPDEIARRIEEAIAGGEAYAARCRAAWLWTRENCSEQLFALRFAELFGPQQP